MRNFFAAIGGALAFTFLWYIGNLLVKNSGIEFVREQGWPVSSAWLVLIIGAVFGVVRKSYLRRAEFRTAAMALATATDLGLEYSPTVERPAVSLPCFQHWQSGKDGNTGFICGEPVNVFDMVECDSSDADGSTCRARTVVLLSAAGLPEIAALPRWFRGWLAHAFGILGMTFDPAAASAGDAETVRRFGRAIRIELPGNQDPWAERTAEAQAHEAAIRRLFTPKLMAALLDYRDWSFQSGGGWLACWRGNIIQPVRERPALIAAARKIRAALLAAAADPAPMVLPPQTLLNQGQFVVRLLGTLVGAIAGCIAGFEFSATTWFNMNQFAFVPFIGMIAGLFAGGFCGYWVSTILGWLPVVARWKLPPPEPLEQKAEKLRRGQWQLVFGFVGWCIGLPAGFAAFIALEDFVRGNGVWKIVFPILAFGGGIAGIICGALIGNRLARRRKGNM
jgi:hypothetical protein